ncbi:hypothetical protein BGZ76_005934, partial [Entomortierella beljakovae]
PLYGRKPPSEADYLVIWAVIFRDGLPLDSLLTLHLGEQGCAAAALSNSQIATAFDTAATPRKCDCILGVDGVEVGNFEAKRASASKTDVGIMLRKNIKISKSILLNLEKYNVGCPPLLNICGLLALVFRIMEYEDIWVAGKALNSIILPTTISEFQLFLWDSAHTLFRLLDDYDAYAKEVRSAKEVYDYRQKALVQDDFATLFDHPVTRILKWEKIVLHSPSKSQQAQSKQAQPKYQDISEYSKKSITYLRDDWTLENEDNDNDTPS